MSENIFYLFLFVILFFSAKAVYTYLKPKLKGKAITKPKLKEIIEKIPKIAENVIILLLASFGIQLMYHTLLFTQQLPDDQVVEVPVKLIISLASAMMFLLTMTLYALMKSLVKP
jgi:protein-S-isoprenylcysteine O-methyltransferase Ste14